MTESSKSNEAGRVRRRILFSGRVQGVGFRFTTREVSRDFEVAGYVRNQADGRVEIVVEGLADEVERFQQCVAKAMEQNIVDVVVSEQGPTGEFSRFEVRR